MDRRYAYLSVIRARGGLGRTIGAVACAWAVISCGQQVPSRPAMTQNEVCENDFDTCIMPILSSQIRREGGAFVSCMDGNCHVAGGNGGRFTLGANSAANLQSVKNLINLSGPASSLLLVEPTNDNVAASAVAGTHGGGNIFQATGDACYRAIRIWLENQFSPPASGNCGLCQVTPDASVSNPTLSCGYP